MKHIILIITGIVIISGLVYAYKLIWGKPFSFNHAVERVTIKTLLRDPETLSFLGLLDNTIVDFHSHKLTDASPAFEIETRRIAERDLELIKSYDRDSLSYQEQLTYDIFAGYLQDIVDSRKFPYHLNNVRYPGPYPVNQLFGVQSEVPAFLESTHRIISVKSAEKYVKRLLAFTVKFNQVLDSLQARDKMDVIPPRFAVTKVINQMEQFIAAPPTENMLYVSFEKKIDECEDIDEHDREKLKKGVISGIEKHVYPAYRKLLAYLEKLQERATTDHGVWKLKNGDDYYRWILRYHTTTDMTPEEIHNLGLREVERIESEMQSILAEQGYRGATVAELIHRLTKEERFLYPDTDEGRNQILTDYAEMLNEIETGCDEYFAVWPKQAVQVQRVPVFKEKTSGGAYYNPPSLDRSRPGVFYVNLRSVEEIPKFEMRTLAYHEAIPGHHFQFAVAQELKGIPTFRRVYPFTAYVEGWALYAEQLAWEMGFQKDPFSNLGRLRAELFRAARLVVDTGLHHKRWTREEAVSYLLEKTGLPETEVITEIERYMVMPGQACAYKLGMIKILELRSRAHRELGDAYDIRDFHDALLKNGSVPLDILERIVDDYIAQKKIAQKKFDVAG